MTKCLILLLMVFAFSQQFVFAQALQNQNGEIENKAQNEGASGREPSAAQKKRFKKTEVKKENKKEALPLVHKIVIKGNKKIEEDAIRIHLKTAEGERLDREKVREEVKELFNTGYFYDVIVDQEDFPEGSTITYQVVEKPSVVSIEYKGNTEIESNELATTTGLKAYQILDYSKIAEAVQKLEKLYEDKGYFLTRITYEVTPEKENQNDSVNLRFNIEENEMVKVKKISFIGNSKLGSGQLKSAMVTQEGGFFSFLGGSGAYKQDGFDRDLQMLKFLYYNQGFVQAKIDRPQVYVTPDKKGIYISIKIEEGEQFNVGGVDFTGDLLFSHEELMSEMGTKEGNLFVYETMQKDIKTIEAKYGDLGYAYANIIPRTYFREKDRRVDIVIEVDKGNKVYIGKINVLGNTRTRDKVVRRELQIREGELYNETRKRESLANVKRLGFFDEVNLNTSTPKGKNDLMDMDIVVKERNTGSIQAGAGYSSYSGFILNGQVSQLNLAGRGQKLGVALDFSKNFSRFNINFTEPYFRDSLWSVGFDAYQEKRLLTEFNETKTGGAFRLGHPLAPYLNGFLRYKLEDTHITLTSEGDSTLFPVDTVNGLTSSVTATLEYDRRDDRILPTSGIFSNLSIEYAGLGGDLSYTKGFSTFRYYRKLFWDVVWRNNITYGFINSNDPDKAEPFNELFLLGGSRSLRGYEPYTVGRRIRSQKSFDEAVAAHDQYAEFTALRPYGGTQELFYNLELQFPLIAEANINGVVFYDIGGADNSLMWDEFRSDVGFGFRWYSPIGPLRFEWGFPFDRRKEFREDSVKFQFDIGPTF